MVEEQKVEVDGSVSLGSYFAQLAARPAWADGGGGGAALFGGRVLRDCR